MTDTASAVTDQVPEMVERGARALCAARNDNPDTEWRIYAGMARVVIEAMREPTAAMQDAGAYIRENRKPVAEVWQAMIEAALG